MKDTKRALRRHHVRRLKKSRQHYWGPATKDPGHAGKVVSTPCPCSCWMCGNPRRHLNEPSRQERMALDQEHADETPSSD